MIGSIITPELRARVRSVATPLAVGFGRVGLTPNHLTLIGFGIAVVASVAAASQAWLAAGILLMLGAVFDLLDGALARATGTATRLGAFMDSVFDRAGEGVVYVGIVAGCMAAGFDIGAVLAAAAMAAAFMVSYVRAKSESLGFTPGSRMAAIGLAPREVRIVILTIGLLGAGALGGVASFGCGIIICVDPLGGEGRPVLAVALGTVTSLATITAIQRIVHVLRQSPQEQ